jgi:hypothetical protein
MNIWDNLDIKKEVGDKDLIKSSDSLTLSENDWNKKYPGLCFTQTDYNFYKKLGRCKYNIENADEPTSLGRFH